MDDEPLPRPVVRARLPGPGLLLFAGLFAFLALDVLVVGVEQVGVGRQVAGLLDRLAFGQGLVLGQRRVLGQHGLSRRGLGPGVGLGDEGVLLGQVAGFLEGIGSVGGHGFSRRG